MAGTATAPERKARLRTELSAADEHRLQQAVVLFGLPKSELVRRLIRAAVQAGPAMSAENTETVITLAQQMRSVGMDLAQIMNAIHRGQAVDMADTEAVWRGLHEALSAIHDELRDMIVANGSKLRRAAKLHVTPETD